MKTVTIVCRTLHGLHLFVGEERITANGMNRGGVTPGVPARFWESWLVENAEADVVRNRMIEAVPDEPFDAAA